MENLGIFGANFDDFGLESKGVLQRRQITLYVSKCASQTDTCRVVCLRCCTYTLARKMIARV